ncbi:NAD-dependent epimerase/dehydratase family protein [Streptomyces sp. NP160]|nr:NAD-dependent epimerase/dehydratase family protein [Streptomyces sp. NP160]
MPASVEAAPGLQITCHRNRCTLTGHRDRGTSGGEARVEALVLGVSGMTGRAVAAALADAGHRVVGTGRSADRFPAALRERGVAFLRSDRHDPVELRAAVGRGADVVVDVLAFTAAHARSVLEASPDVGSVVVVSSKAVYRDAQGRHSNSDEAPDFGGPVTEDTPTLAPDWSGAYDSRAGYGPTRRRWRRCTAVRTCRSPCCARRGSTARGTPTRASSGWSTGCWPASAPSASRTPRAPATTRRPPRTSPRWSSCAPSGPRTAC